MVVTLLAILLCSLGAHLHVAGARTLPLPWAIVDRLPVIGLMLPARFMVYCDLAAALLATTWLSRTHHRRSAWVLVLLSIAFLAPAVRRGYWNSVPPVPRLFRSSAYRRTFRARDIVLVLPMGFAGQSMLWQADAHLGFRMAGGYIVPPTAPDPYKKYAIYPTLTGGTPVADKDAAAARFIAAEHITVAVLGATAASGSPWPRIFKRLGWRATTREGAVLFRPAPPRMRSAARATSDNADPHSPHRRVLAGSRAFG